MAGTPVLVVENIFSVVQFPDHTVTADEEATGYEGWRVADGRRSALDKWTTTTTNTTHTITVTCDKVRACDFIALDRGHNLDGETVKLQGSNDNFTSSEDVLEITLPLYSSPGDIDSALGVVTEEGAWVKRFDLRAFTYWRFTVPSMGAGEMPEVVGLTVGKSYNGRCFDFPWSDGQEEALAPVAVMESGWEGSGPVTIRRRGEFGLRAQSDIDHDEAKYHLAHFARRRPMWFCADSEQADRTIQVIHAGAVGFQHDGAWPHARSRIQYAEHEPA